MGSSPCSDPLSRSLSRPLQFFGARALRQGGPGARINSGRVRRELVHQRHDQPRAGHTTQALVCGKPGPSRGASSRLGVSPAAAPRPVQSTRLRGRGGSASTAASPADSDWDSLEAERVGLGVTAAPAAGPRLSSCQRGQGSLRGCWLCRLARARAWCFSWRLVKPLRPNGARPEPGQPDSSAAAVKCGRCSFGCVRDGAI